MQTAKTSPNDDFILKIDLSKTKKELNTDMTSINIQKHQEKLYRMIKIPTVGRGTVGLYILFSVESWSDGFGLNLMLLFMCKCAFAISASG